MGLSGFDSDLGQQQKRDVVDNLVDRITVDSNES